MNAQHAGHAGGDRGLHRTHGDVDDGEVVADQGGKKTGCPEGAVGRADGGDCLDRRGVVEQHAAAAIDLGVDKAGDQQIAAQIMSRRARRRIACVEYRGDLAVLDHHAFAVEDAGLGQDAAIYKYSQHQTVSVTLLRWGGLSGS